MPKRMDRARRRSGDSRAPRPPTTAVLRRHRPEESPLARAVPHLAPEALQQLVAHRGLTDCGEIVAAATPAQLTAVLDIDLWRGARPGEDARLDADRFGEWLELLAEGDSAVAVRTLSALDETLVVAALSRLVRVLDPAVFLPTAQSDDEPQDGGWTPHEGAECEMGGYLVRAKSHAAWDAVVALLIALDAEDPERFHALMRAVRRVSDSTPEIDGLDERLPGPDQLLHDAAGDRDERRSRQGYATPADARAFLQMARERHGASPANPIAAACFRAVGGEAAPAQHPRETPPPAGPAPDAEALEAVAAVVERLAAAGAAPRGALPGGPGPRASRLARIRLLLEDVRERDPSAYLARQRELAFLANTLLAGCSLQSRPFTPPEAAEAAVSVCQLGLERWPEASARSAAADTPETLPEAFLVHHGLVAVFEVGWAALHEAVCLYAAEGLDHALEALRCRDAGLGAELRALRVELGRHAGRPWLARGALEVLGALDGPAWVGLLGVLGECPVLPAALTATLGGWTGAISPTDFEFISTNAQVAEVREFVEGLAGIFRRAL